MSKSYILLKSQFHQMSQRCDTRPLRVKVAALRLSSGFRIPVPPSSEWDTAAHTTVTLTLYQPLSTQQLL